MEQTMLHRLKRLHAECLGLYMARRLMGETGEVQKKRLLWLAQKIMIYQELNRIMEKTKHLQLRFKPIGFELTDHDTGRTATVLSGRDYSRSIDIHEISHPECEAIGREIYDFILKDCLQGESRLKGVEVDITVNVDIKSQHQ